MSSISIAIGVFLFSLPFYIISVHSLKKYLEEKQTGQTKSQKKHIFYAFLIWSVGFTSAVIGAAMISPSMDMDSTTNTLVVILHKLFDAFNILGCFFFFVFLTDFVERLKKYIPFFTALLIITLLLIFVTPSGVLITEDGHIPWRSDIASAAILFSWIISFAIISLQFWKHSKSMQNNVAIRRSQMISIGAFFMISAYIFVISAQELTQGIMLVFGQISAITSGIVFYIAFVIPDWLRRIWEKKI